MEIKTLELKDISGGALANALVYIYVPGTKVIVAGIVDGSGVPMNNPFRSDANGEVQVGAPNGEYDLVTTYRGRVYKLRLIYQDVEDSLYLTPLPFGAKGDGVTNDSTAFAILEQQHTGVFVDLLGKTYLVDAPPTGNRYGNGFFSFSASTFPSAYKGDIRYWDRPINTSGPGGGGLAIGTNAAANILDYSDANSSQGFIAIGRDALATSTRGRSCIAIGQNTLSKASPGFANLAIGDFALTNVAGISSAASELTGSRNIGIGSLAGHFITSGSLNIFIGRDSGHCVTSGVSNTAIGYRALSGGYAPVGLSGTIENQTPVTASGRTAVGNGALQNSSGTLDTAIGEFAGRNLKKGGSNTTLGGNAGANIDADLSENGKLVTSPNITGTYSQAGAVLTITATASGAVAGNKVGFSLTTGANSVITTDMQWLTVATVVDANTFTVATPSLPSGSGALIVNKVETASLRTAASTNTLVGNGVLQNAKTAQAVTAMGWQAGLAAEGGGNTLYGQRSGYGLTSGENNTFIGINAGRTNPLGGSITTFSNSTAIGKDSGVSGDLQVQLGGAGTTPYAYAALQIRSDERDKIDFRPLSNPIEFIRGIEWVEFRKNERGWYFDEVIDEDGNSTMVEVPNDGSRAGTRFHGGVKAQQVQALCESLGMDWAGLQDHAVNGGMDIYSVAYEALIPYLGYCVDHLLGKLEETEGRLARIEAALGLE